MTSPSSSTASSPIPGDAYFADLYSLASPAHSPVHSRSPSPICAPPPPPPAHPVAMGKKSIVDYENYTHNNKHIPNQNQNQNQNQNHNGNHHSNSHGKNTPHNTAHNPHKPHRPPPYRPRLEFAPPPQAPYRPSLSFLPSGGTSPASISASTSASPLTPESPPGGSGCENSAGQRERKYAPLGLGDEERDVKEGGVVSAQKIKRRAQNRAAQRAFRARQAERVRELEREVEGLRGELEGLRGRLRERGLCG